MQVQQALMGKFLQIDCPDWQLYESMLKCARHEAPLLRHREVEYKQMNDLYGSYIKEQDFKHGVVKLISDYFMSETFWEEN